MKKLLCFFVCFLLIVPSALADTPPVRLSEDDPLYTSLLERSMELAGLFNEALHSESYLSLLQMPDDLKEELALVQIQDFTQPLDVTIVRAEDAFAMYEGNDPWIMLFSADVSPALKAIGVGFLAGYADVSVEPGVRTVVYGGKEYGVYDAPSPEGYAVSYAVEGTDVPQITFHEVDLADFIRRANP